MAIKIKKKYTGQQSTSVLGGQIRIEDGNNRMVVARGSLEMVTIDDNGLVLSDGTNRRMIIGRMPDSTIGVAISKPGEDVFEAF